MYANEIVSRISIEYVALSGKAAKRIGRMEFGYICPDVHGRRGV